MRSPRTATARSIVKPWSTVMIRPFDRITSAAGGWAQSIADADGEQEEATD